VKLLVSTRVSQVYSDSAAAWKTPWLQSVKSGSNVYWSHNVQTALITHSWMTEIVSEMRNVGLAGAKVGAHEGPFMEAWQSQLMMNSHALRTWPWNRAEHSPVTSMIQVCIYYLVHQALYGHCLPTWLMISISSPKATDDPFGLPLIPCARCHVYAQQPWRQKLWRCWPSNLEQSATWPANIWHHLQTLWLLLGGTAVAVLPSFRLGDPALFGSHPLVTP